MSVARVLEYYEQVADAPDAVEKLRRFMLDLAVRGKLVEQVPSDRPAAVSPLQENDEPPFDLPIGWVWSNIGSLCSKTGSGSTPRGGRAVYKPSGIPFLRSQNVHDAGLRLDDVAYVDEQTHRRMAGTAVKAGDLLLNITGGSIGRCCPVGKELGEANVSQHVAIIRAADQEMRDFLHCAILSPFTQSQIIGEQTGAGRGGLPKNRMDRIPVPVPPVAEQHRIVAKVDELMALCDQLEAARADREATRERFTVATFGRLTAASVGPTEFREHARFALDSLAPLTARIEQIRQLRQTILDLAVRGKLAPQNVNDEPATTLLNSITQERLRFAKLAGKKPLERVGSVDASEMPFALPHSWEWAYLGDLLLEDSQNGYSRSPDDAPDGIPILRISAGTIRPDGIVAEEEHKLIGGVSSAHRGSFSLQSGDLLACRFNGNRRFVGRLSLFEDYLKLSPIYPDKLIRFRLPKQFVCPPLVRMFAESGVGRAEIENFCATTVGNWGISASNLKRVRIPLPPIAEQRRIVAKVDELMAICDQLEVSIESQEQDRSRLLDAAVVEALQGH